MFNNNNNESNIFVFISFIKIQKGTTYKLKGSTIDTAIFTVTEKNELFSGSGTNAYNVTFTNPNINSGKRYFYNNISKDPLFELSVKN